MDTPPGGYITSTSTGVAFTTFELSNTASSTENIILDLLAVTNFGTSSTTPHVFSELYLYEDDTLIASTTIAYGINTAVFKDVNYVLPTSTTVALTVRGDLGSGATPGHTIRMGLNDQNSIKAIGSSTGSSTIITGYFPIIGNTFTIY